MATAEVLDLWAAGAKALSDPTRIARVLRAAGLAASAREGKMMMMCTLTDRGRALLAAVSATRATA